ncbi:MAG: sulfatase-like hydrolase/transferase, partial [Desulfobacterales bacterium]|nr:sulfatase-like hydrolase/transferase [Desulfobacterales bacterium]
MRNTYTAAYRKGNTLVTAFLSQQAAAESARVTVVQYARYAKKYGKGIDRLKAGEVELISCDMGGSYDVVFHKGHLMGGVSSVEDRDLAIRVAIEMAMCSPTRAALLTGRNHHRVGAGQIAELASDWDGYIGKIPRSTAMIAQVLSYYGYS